MSMYDVTIWSDYVRGLVDPEKRAELAAHLELPGSEAARRTVAAFSGLLSFAGRDAAAEPPAAALRSVKALGSLLHPGGADSWLTRLRSLLIFDSATAPLAAGVRALCMGDRQLIYEGNDYLVDLRLEQESPNGPWMVVGQLLRGQNGVAPLADVPVLAAREDRFVGRARTGPLGEFQAEGLPGGDFILFFLVSNEICLEVPVRSTADSGR